MAKQTMKNYRIRNRKERLRRDTLVLAICGKSCAGKDTLARWLTKYLINCGYSVNNVRSDTTRPKRVNEFNGVDYTFISNKAFEHRIKDGRYLEYARFKGWYYGIPKENIKEGMINIVVVNPAGLENLQYQQHKMTVLPVYLKASTLTRLRRSIERENEFKLEYIRRLITDQFDFFRINKKLDGFNNTIVMSKYDQGVFRQTGIIERHLERYDLSGQI